VVGEWARAQGLQVTTERDLLGKPEVRRLIQREIDLANHRLSDAEQIQRFELLPVDLDEVGAVTATQKVRRARVGEQFGELVEGMYR
jgi:long-chain acyl-CoA synthetase